MPSANPVISAQRQPLAFNLLIEYAQEENDKDWRRQISLHALQVIIQAAPAADHGIQQMPMRTMTAVAILPTHTSRSCDTPRRRRP